MTKTEHFANDFAAAVVSAFSEFYGPPRNADVKGSVRTSWSEESARRVIGSKEAGAIALDLIQAFYAEAPPGKTPFGNLAIVNKLQDLTFGKFNFDELLKFLNEALDRYWDIRTG